MERNNISLYDTGDDKIYEVSVSTEDAHRASTDMQFAATLLNAVKLEKNQHADQAVEVVETPYSSELNINEKDNEDSDHLYRWTHPCILLLLQSYQEMESKIAEGKISHKKCWDTISKKLKSEGHNISGPQCGSKLRSLKKTYKSITDHNSKSGNDRRTWQYFELMNEIFGRKAWCKPVAVASSTGLSTRRDDPDHSDESDRVSGATVPSRSSSIPVLLAKRLKQREEHEEAKKKRHEEKMALDRHLLEILTKLVEK